jgi:hypothetical protein
VEQQNVAYRSDIRRMDTRGCREWKVDICTKIWVAIIGNLVAIIGNLYNLFKLLTHTTVYCNNIAMMSNNSNNIAMTSNDCNMCNIIGSNSGYTQRSSCKFIYMINSLDTGNFGALIPTWCRQNFWFDWWRKFFPFIYLKYLYT